MTSSAFSRRRSTERDFIADLSGLLKRHKIPCGHAEDLDLLGPELSANEPFRSDLFTLCEAISHLSKFTLAHQQLLELVACAVVGRSTTPQQKLEISSATESTFLTGYEEWLANKSARFNGPIRTAVQPSMLDESQVSAEETPGEESDTLEAEALQEVGPVSLPAESEGPVPQPFTRRTMASIPILSNSEIDRYNARIDRLRATNSILLVLLLAAAAAAAGLGYMYLHLEKDYAELAGRVDRILSPAPQPAPAPAAPSATADLRPPAPPASSPSKAAPLGPSGKATPVPPPPSPSLIHPEKLEQAPLPPAPPAAASATVRLPASTMKIFSVSTPAPAFPDVAIGEETSVDVQATISRSGTVRTTRVLSGNPTLGLVAAHAMRAWQFRPFHVNGKPVEVITAFSFHAESE